MSLEDAPGAARCRRCGSTLRTRGLAGICLRCLALDGIENEGAALTDDGKGSGFGPGRTIGDYELLEEVGHGGMGVVFKARQNRLERVVAIKVLRAGWLAKAGELARFRSEAKTLAGLRHPNIVAVHEVGEYDGQPYFSMDFVAGHTLEELTRGHPLPALRAAQYVRRIAEAIQYAHEREVLHRDLKPSNVIIDGDDQPRVTDFGLAKRLEGDADLTMTGQVLGSPNFMPPEQASAGRGEVGPASDVYSLGALLYHLLTGRPPFLSETITDTLRQVAENDPASPRLLVPTVPKDLETICLKCLQKEPKHRYATAQAVADDLGRFLSDEPIQARPSGSAEKLWRWCRRNRALAVSAGIGAVLVLTVAIGSPIAAFRINREREQAERAHKQEAALRVRAESAERETELQLYTALLEEARATVQNGELGQRVRALEAVRRAGTISNSAALRGAAIAALALPDLRFDRELPTTQDMTLLSLDPAFERIAIGRGPLPIEIRSVADQHLIAALPASTNQPAYTGLWSPDGRFLAVGRDNVPYGQVKDLEVWDVAAAKQVLLLHASPWGAMSFHPRLPRFISACAPASAVIWDLETGRELARHELSGAPRVLKYAPDGERFATLRLAGNLWVVTIHRAADGEPGAVHTFTNVTRELTWHPSGRWLAVPDFDGTVNLMDSQTGETRVLGRHKAEAMVAEFSPDGRYLFTGGWDRQLICWDVKALRRAFTIDLDSYHLQISGDGRQCAVLRWPEVRLQIHRFEMPALHREFAEDLGSGRKVAAFSPDGRWLAVSGGDRVAAWDLSSHGPGAISQDAWTTRVGFAPNGELFADRGGACFRWRLTAATNAEAAPRMERLSLNRPEGFSSLSLMSRGVLFTGQLGSRLTSYDRLTTENGDWAKTLNGLNGVSPDERWVAVFPSYARYLEVYRLSGLERVANLTNGNGILRFEFSPLGDRLAVASRGGVAIWSTTNWQRLNCLTNFTDIHYSSDGRALWLTAWLRGSGLYDSITGESILPLPPGTQALALSPDQRYLAASVDARRIQLWDLQDIRKHLHELGLDWSEAQLTDPIAGAPLERR